MNRAAALLLSLAAAAHGAQHFLQTKPHLDPAVKSKFVWEPITPAVAKQCQAAVDYGNSVGFGKRSSKSEVFPQYYDLDLPGLHIKGDRTPQSRLDLLKAADPSVTFDGKSWLDFGANMGGMLFAVATEVRWGVGVEYNTHQVNTGNRLAHAYGANHISMFTFNLEEEPLPVIRDFLPEDNCEGAGKDENCVDIASMYAINVWINNFEEAMVFARKTSRHLILELNGWDKMTVDPEDVQALDLGVEQLEQSECPWGVGDNERYRNEPIHAVCEQDVSFH